MGFVIIREYIFSNKFQNSIAASNPVSLVIIMYLCFPWDLDFPIKYPKKVIDVIDTLQGVHLITTPFNSKQFKETCKDLIDIHKDNPTLLYYENNESN